MTPGDRLGAVDPETARARLSEQRAETGARIDALQRHVASILETSEWTSHDDEHDPEGSTLAFERAQLQGLLEDARRELRELDEAERRLQAGTYGTCERCSGAIGPQRLEALPAARVCVSCASARR
ncbi:TraR/DksA family transcriptional regulator [Salinifilum ghardaiensis]